MPGASTAGSCLVGATDCLIDLRPHSEKFILLWHFGIAVQGCNGGRIDATPQFGEPGSINALDCVQRQSASVQRTVTLVVDKGVREPSNDNVPSVYNAAARIRDARDVGQRTREPSLNAVIA